MLVEINNICYKRFFFVITTFYALLKRRFSPISSIKIHLQGDLYFEVFLRR